VVIIAKMRRHVTFAGRLGQNRPRFCAIFFCAAAASVALVLEHRQSHAWVSSAFRMGRNEQQHQQKQLRQQQWASELTAPSRIRPTSTGHWQPHGRGSVGMPGFQRPILNIMCCGVVAALLALSAPAWASFGSSGGAVLSTPPVQTPTLEQLEQLGQDQRSRILSNLGLQTVDKLQKDLRNSRALTEKKMSQLANQRETVKEVIEKKKKQELEVQAKIKKMEREIAELQDKRDEIRMNKDTLERQKNELDGSLITLDETQGELGNILNQAKESFKKLLSKEAEEGSEQLANLDAETTLAKEQEEQQKLDEVLEQRRKLLAALEAQPEWFAYMAAFGASVGATLIMHPVDTLKTRLVAKSKEHPDGEPSPTLSLAELPSLYDGLIGNVLKEGPSSALYLGVYETVKVQLEATPLADSNLVLVYLLAGGAGELVGSVVRAPAEAVKSRLQSGLDSSPLESLQQVSSDQGRERIVRAWGASCFRDVPAGAIQIAIFELAKVFIVSRPSIAVGVDVNSLAFEAFLGAVAGGFAAFVTTPADVITTQIITRPQPSHGSGSSTEEATAEQADPNILERFIQNYEEGGVDALFVGWKERTAYWTPAIGLFLSFYCTVRQAAIAADLFTPAILP